MNDRSRVFWPVGEQKKVALGQFQTKCRSSCVRSKEAAIAKVEVPF